jgi:signal transduction histidine kinase
MESIGKLAGGIAHDFNNVLTAVIGFAELARGRVQDETTLRYIDGIIQAAERAANLNRQLLAYARRQVVQLSPLNLDVWLQTTLDILRRVLPENIDLQTEVDPKLSAIQGDSDLLLQIVLNLVVNARDAMPNGGVIRITLQNKTLRRPHQTVPAGRYVALSVADTGSGIPSEVLLYIFEPFFSTKPVGQGTGMGLAAVHGAVQQLGSHIEVQTELGKGTCFTVYFPRLDPTRLPRQTSGTPAE